MAPSGPLTVADLQRDPTAPRPPARADALPLEVTRTRTFDTPEFAGMTFLEVEAKTALNKVKGMPFPWSINPYRGCSHACSYCLAGDTPVLMADGRTKPLADVRPGDRVYGTRRQGRYRRYVTTEVRDHWSTTKKAYRVTFSDGTALVGSADHRLLTRRGWKHIVGTQHGAGRRAHLTTNDLVPGTGRFADPPKDSPQYRLGYLAGMIRGDAHLGTYHYGRPGRRHGDVHRFRLALVDREPLERTRRYLEELGVPTTSFDFTAATPTRKPLRAIRTSAGWAVQRIGELIAWPLGEPPDGWLKGFLAGIYDAEGGCSRGVLRITNSDARILATIRAGFARYGFAWRNERTSNGCHNLRLLGGLSEQLRFFLTVDPATTRKRTLEGRAVKTTAPLRVAAVEPLGITMPMFDITTGTGDFIADGVISHNCFARPTHAYLNLSPLGDFERTVVVKTNVAEVLRRELARPSWKGEHVAMGTNTDPYQRCEGRYRLMPGIIRALAESYTPFSILTKGTLITRDLEELRAAAAAVPVSAALTIGMLDESLWRAAEPGTPSPRARLQAVAALNAAGIPTGVMLAPIMPGLNDDREQLGALIDAAARARATAITPIVLHLRPGVRELFWPWLEATYPELVERYAALYQRTEARKDYIAGVQGMVRELREAAWRRHGRPAAPPPWRRSDRLGVAPGGDAGSVQLSLL